MEKVGGKKNGKIDFHEFLEIIVEKISAKDSQPEIESAFALFDKDKDGFISIEELAEVCKELDENLSNEELKEMIEGASKKGARKISLNEFKAIMTKNAID